MCSLSTLFEFALNKTNFGVIWGRSKRALIYRNRSCKDTPPSYNSSIALVASKFWCMHCTQVVTWSSLPKPEDQGLNRSVEHFY